MGIAFSINFLFPYTNWFYTLRVFESRNRSEKEVEINNSYKEKTMAKKLYVGGLPYTTTEDSLKEAFSQAGTVESAMVIMDKMTGRSKGFGFVEMSTEEEATKAIDMWNGKDFEGRNLTVAEARPMEDRPPRRDFDRRGPRSDYGGRRNSW
jgi:RNA recognition motif-containing protein